MTSSTRGTIHLETGSLTEVKRYSGEQYIVRLHAPETASRATPGSFAHISCDETIPMRRPLSIMRADRTAGTIDILFKVMGDGLRALAARRVGDSLSVLGPIGKGFTYDNKRPRALLIGGGVGIPPMVFLAEELKKTSAAKTVVLMGSELPFPFEMGASTESVTGIDAQVNSCMQELESQGIPSRLASLAGFDGCFDGYVTELARSHLATLTAAERREVQLYACGPTPMLEATARLAAEFGVPCQVSLEEFMACAVGGCAGCAVEVTTDAGVAMKRVCVDGPVFAAETVFPNAGAT